MTVNPDVKKDIEIDESLEVFLDKDLRTAALGALTMDLTYGGYDGGHHKQWVLDQIVRALTGENYDEFIKFARAGEDGPETYSWDVGIAP